MTYTNEEFANMVQADRVHRAYYTDPDVFDVEMRKVFGKVWVYVGHDSLVPRPGDYYCTTLAGQPVVLSRDDKGGVHVLYNRCGHRGAKVLSTTRGNARVFSCMYHGWGFRPNGELAGVPMRADFPEASLNEARAGMERLARVDSYRGFVFASMDPDVMPLLDFLGVARQGIDELVDRSPEGRIEFSAGCHRYHFRGNWKLQMDNMADTYHPAAAHGSTVGRDGRQFQRRAGQEGGAALFFAPNGEAVVSQLGVRGFKHGHSSEQSLFDKEQSGGVWDEYRAMLVARHGEERTADILKNRRHSLTLFPTLDILIAQTSVRVVKPIAVDFTEVEVWPVRLAGAPEVISEDLVKYLNMTHSASSFIQTDDLEAFERCQEGMKAHGSDWILVARGMGSEIDEGDGVLFGARSSEVGQRAKHYAWRALMSA
ncbi:aromatic-ring-hydroxylating dioxygenase subunit alpha [Pigmentiphaga sp. NML080357]|uniref:aromatic ring-hydroxylating dioxygenase subunit alpha n=1 Tax=Pigmentiphaga sp. NML080357 TaxID=2008675 RepID=UPI000B41B1C3|nr:aromatic ring-hydroxylating dioxygenase subunit alpha [Pigmentiphaga sp. NML080357]OVZ64870.1 aromatic-ring-hydroxylating dioxygenase subunit alpha [Pigmentiphaga sp. NML080357]